MCQPSKSELEGEMDGSDYNCSRPDVCGSRLTIAPEQASKLTRVIRLRFRWRTMVSSTQETRNLTCIAT